MAPHLGLIETCSYQFRKCHTMLLLVLLQGELSRGLMSSSRLTLWAPRGRKGRKERSTRMETWEDFVAINCSVRRRVGGM